MMTKSTHILLRKKKSGVAFVLFDSPGKNNFITAEVLRELASTIQEIEQSPEINSAVFISGKADTFIAGASLQEISRFSSREDATALVKLGHQVFAALAALTKPTVAAINGACLGGGLELALCCHRRISTNTPDTVLGLPELSHGLIPGLGGTQRLPRLIGPQKAVELMLASEIISSRQAREFGIVEALVSPDHLLNEAEKLAIELTQIDSKKWIESADQLNQDKLNKFFAACSRSVRIRTRGNYPAYANCIETVRIGLIRGMEAGLEKEKEHFADLAVSQTARNLIALFFNTELARQQANKIAKEHFANRVALILPPESPLAKLFENYGVATTINQQSSNDDLIMISENWDGLNHDLNQVRCKLLSLRENMQPGATLALITSTLSIEALATNLPFSENFLGLQFLNPIFQMPAVELITHSGTSRRAIGAASSIVRRLHKLPLVVPDAPGYLINRIFTRYLLQAARLAEKGTPVNWLEQSATNFGMPVGPFAALDEIGLERAQIVASLLAGKFGERFAIPDCLTKALKAGLNGRESGIGTYSWKEDRREELNPLLTTDLNFVTSSEKLSDQQSSILAHKMILPMVDEAARCLEENILRRAREIDLGLVLGIGFPKFRGGLLKYADTVGIKQIIAELDEIYQETSPVSRISDYLKRLQDQHRGFYSKVAEQN